MSKTCFNNIAILKDDWISKTGTDLVVETFAQKKIFYHFHLIVFCISAELSKILQPKC